jgi:hypothetical protein
MTTKEITKQGDREDGRVEGGALRRLTKCPDDRARAESRRNSPLHSPWIRQGIRDQQPLKNRDIRRGIDSLAPARFGLTARPSMSLGSRRLHSRCGLTFSQIATRVMNIDIRRGTPSEVRTARSRCRSPGTRRFCLRNCGSRFFRCRDKGCSQD